MTKPFRELMLCSCDQCKFKLAISRLSHAVAMMRAEAELDAEVARWRSISSTSQRTI